MDQKEGSGPRLGIAAAVACVTLYALMALVCLRPFPSVWKDRIAPSAEDPLFNLWVLEWSAHQIRLGLPDLWDANIFYPTRGTLTFSDHLLGLAAEHAVLREVLPSPVASYNVLLFASFVLTGLAVAFVVRRGGASRTAAGLAGFLYTFSPFRISQLNHIQLLTAQWLPLTLWSWDRLLAKRRPRDAALFLLFYLLNVTGGCYLAYMVHVPLLVILLVRLSRERRELLDRRSLRVLLPTMLAAAFALAAVFLPYVRVSRELGLARDAEEARKYGATLVSYVSPARNALWFRPGVKTFLRRHFHHAIDPLFRTENSLFAGFLPTSLAILGLALAWRRLRERSSLLRWREGWREADPWELSLALSGLAAFALSFPIVYVPLMAVVPGLDGMRVPARWAIVVSLTVAWFAARGFDGLRERLPGRKKTAFAGIVALLLAAELAPRAPRWVHLETPDRFPEVYRWIAGRPDIRAILELPVRPNSTECAYMYFSTVHWKPLANGYSGYRPASHRALAERMRFLPDDAGLDLIQDLWLSHLVVHEDQLRVGPGRLAAWEARYLGRRVALVHVSGPDRVYRVLPSSSTPNRAGL
jgi:hypothetical protein